MVPVVMGTPTTNLIGNTVVSGLGAVNYTGAMYGTTLSSSGLSQHDGSFSSVINLSTRTLNSFDGRIAGTRFGFTGGNYALQNQTVNGGTGSGFSNIPVTGIGVTGVTGTINGSLYGPNAENVGGNFNVQNSPNGTRTTGVYLGGRPH